MGVHHADLDQVNRAQLPEARFGPRLLDRPEPKRHPAQIVPFSHGAHIAAEGGVRQVDDEGEACVILGQAQCLRGGTAQQAAGIMVDECQDIRSGREAVTKRPGQDRLAETADPGLGAELGCLALKAPAPINRAELKPGAMLEAVRKAGGGHHGTALRGDIRDRSPLLGMTQGYVTGGNNAN